MPKDRKTKIEWTNDPGRKANDPQREIYRQKGKHPLRFVCLSHDLVGTTVHYGAGGSKPCTGENCNGCANGLRPDKKFWVAAYIDDQNPKVIVEMTERAAQVLRDLFCRERTLRGFEVQLFRTNGKDLGPQGCRILSRVADNEKLPKSFNVMQAWLVIWKMKETTAEQIEPNNHEQAEAQAKAARSNGINNTVGQQPADGHERPRRLGPADDLRLVAEEDSSVRQGAATRASDTGPSNPEKQTADGSGSVVHISEAVARRLGISLQNGQP